MQDLWRTHYQILLIILLKEFIKYKYGHDDKKCETMKLNTKITSALLNSEALQII